MKNLKIQNSLSTIVLIMFLIIAAVVLSWGLTCLIVYLISLLWVGTAFAFTWSWEFATGVWLALALLGSFCQAKVNFHD